MPNTLDDKSRIRQAVDILDVVGSATVLKRKNGPWHLGLCPFHSEKTPSFRVHSEGHFYCFGCGAKGDVFAFVMMREGLDFREALNYLADRYNIELTDSNPQRPGEVQHQREALRQAQAFYRQILETGLEGASARDYVASRGLAPAIRERFGIGAAPSSWDSLFLHLTRSGFEASVLEEAGLVRTNSIGGYRDLFRGRLIFPISNDTGTVIGFGGRALDPRDPAKYLNSPESSIYQKGQHVYGLHLAKDAIRAADTALLVEGYMDVVSLHQAGFANAVAVLGTAMTQTQAKNLLRYTESKRVVVAFDADRAGQDAAVRGIGTLEEVARAVGLGLAILSVPEGKDPDAFIQARGPAAFAVLVAEAPGVVEFQIDHVLRRQRNLESPQGKAEALQSMVPILQRLGSPALAEPFLRMVAARLALNELTVTMEFNKYLRHNGALRAGTRPEAVTQYRVAEAERGLIVLMVEELKIRRLVATRLESIPLASKGCQAIRECLCGSLAEEVGWSRLLEALDDSPERDLLLALRFEASEWVPDDPLLVADDYIEAIAWGHWQGIVSRLRSKLAAPDLGNEEVQQITRDIQDAQIRAQEHKSNLQSPRRGPGRTRTELTCGQT